jgi:hypothetical protein
MLLSAFIITVLYVLVALVLFGVLVVDGKKWRFKAPVRHSPNRIRDFFGQFSWGRLHRPSTQTLTHSTSFSSGGTKPANIRGALGSIRLGSFASRSTDVKAHLDVSDGPSTAATIQSVDLTRRPDTGSTSTSGNSLERGRKNTAKTIGNQDFKRENKQPGVQTHTSVANQVSGKALQLKALAIKMLWYPIGMCLVYPSLRAQISNDTTFEQFISS